MLIAAGPGVARMTDYSTLLDASSFQASSAQGTTLDTLTLILYDRTNRSTILPEDDIVALDESDPNGWPTVNLLANPSFEGTYVSGVAPSWAAFSNKTGGTATPSSSATARYGSASQSVACTNVVNGAAGGFYEINQQVTLPRTETGAVQGATSGLPFYFSCSYQVTAAFVGANLIVAIDWHDAANTYLSTAGTVWATTPGVSGVWLRAYASGIAPANAVYAVCYLQYAATATTNSGTFLMDGALLEYATYGAVPVPVANPLNLANPNFTGTVGAGVATGWSAYNGGASGVTYSVVAVPAIGGSAQQIALASATPTQALAVAQTLPLMNPLWSYTLTLWYQITTTLSPNATPCVGVIYTDINGNPIGSGLAARPFSPPITGGWQTVSLSFGPAYGTSVTTNAYGVRVFAGVLDTLDASVSGVIVLGALYVSVYGGNPDAATAITAQKYPTPYCDATQPGCHVETGRSGLAYRQLRAFGGYVKQLDTDLSAGPEPVVTLHAVEYGTLLQEAPVTLQINNMTDTAAIAAGVAYAQALGYLVGLDATTYVVGVNTIDAQQFTQNTFRDLMDYIANEAVAAYYVDYYCALHYGSALSVSAPFSLSDTPDGISTFPYSKLVYTQDSTQTVTEPVVEGAPQTSAPQTYTGSGVNATLSSGLTNGTPYTALPVAAVAVAIPQGSIVTLNVGGGTTQQVTTSAPVAVGALSIPVNSFTANATYAASTPVAIATLFTVYNGAAIQFVDSVSAAGVAQTVGLDSNDTLGAGSPVITALYNPGAGTVQLLTAIGAAQSVSVVFRFSAPVLVRLHATASSAADGPVGRKIFSHVQLTSITSKGSAIARASATIRQNGKAVPVVTCMVTTPPAPTGVMLRAGFALTLTNRTLGWSTGQLLQIQQVTTAIAGSGRIYRTLQLGFYRPDAIVLLAQSRRESATATSQLAGDTILEDVLSTGDAWAIVDSVRATTSNVGHWNGTSTWNGSNVWS